MTWLWPHAPPNARCELCPVHTRSTHSLLTLDEHTPGAQWVLVLWCCRYHAGFVARGGFDG